MSQPPVQWDAELYEARHAFVWKQGTALLELLAPRAGESILDLGCGTGHLTAEIAATGARVMGLDQATMIEQARQAHPGLQFDVGDARDFTFAEPFDAIFSNAVLHWIPEPERVIGCGFRALRPGGRFVAEFGGKGNVRAIVQALEAACDAIGGEAFVNPWYFPTVGEYASLLERAGMEVTFATLFDRPTPLEGEDGMRNWIAMFARETLARIPTERRERFLGQIEEHLRPNLFRDGTWFADYRRLRIVARRPAT